MQKKEQDGIVGTSDDFTGNLEDWEQRIFRDVELFRLHRYYGMGSTDRAEVHDFREALKLAVLELRKPGHRVILYAVAKTGRWFQIPQDQWYKYLKIWDAQHSTQ